MAGTFTEEVKHEPEDHSTPRFESMAESSPDLMESDGTSPSKMPRLFDSDEPYTTESPMKDKVLPGASKFKTTAKKITFIDHSGTVMADESSFVEISSKEKSNQIEDYSFA